MNFGIFFLRSPGCDRVVLPQGRTPLNIAAEMGHWKVVQRLIDARADLEAQDDGCPGAWERRFVVASKRAAI